MESTCVALLKKQLHIKWMLADEVRAGLMQEEALWIPAIRYTVTAREPGRLVEFTVVKPFHRRIVPTLLRRARSGASA